MKAKTNGSKKILALIAHDNKKAELMRWLKKQEAFIRRFDLIATGTTGGRIEKETGFKVERLKSGPQGGDMQIGARVAEGRVQAVIFLWDPLSPHPHDVDVKALLRIAALYNIPLACNLATAECFISGF